VELSHVVVLRSAHDTVVCGLLSPLNLERNAAGGNVLIDEILLSGSGAGGKAAEGGSDDAQLSQREARSERIMRVPEAVFRPANCVTSQR
jgi:hypothetical protein